MDGHREIVPAVPVSGFCTCTEPGQFYFIADRIFFTCPCGDGHMTVLPIGEGCKPAESPSWQWDGNRDRPTLTPSIRQLDGCRWHGFLTAGQFVPCADSGGR